MTFWTKTCGLLPAMLWLASSAQAQTTLSEKLVSRFSSRWSDIQSELSDIGERLESLPIIPLGDLGGTGGLIVYTVKGSEVEVFVRWDKPSVIDLVALVPARRFNWDGLDPEFGLSNVIEVELLDEKDKPVCLVAREDAASFRPIQKGFPFVYSLSEPMMAHGVRIRCREHKRHEFPVGRIYALALAELFCFSGQRNVAAGAVVHVADYSVVKQDHWFWRAGFLVDGLTPLGLPENPAPDLRHIGWCSEAHASEDTGAIIDIEFDQPVKMDGMRMFPSRTTTSEDPPGFALPQRFRLVAFDKEFIQPSHVIFDHLGSDLMNPGHNPITFRFPETTVQHVRLECSKIWKKFPHYPAFLAFSEIQLLHDETNLAEGAVVNASERKGIVKAHLPLLWSEESLTDGHGPQGELVPRRRWLCLLKKRFELETRQQELLIEAENMVASLRNLISRTFGVVGIMAVLALFILPVRYRFRERRQLRKMRLRIAGDLHDEVGSNLGSIQILADLAQRKWSDAEEMSTISQIAAETVAAVRDIVWLLRPRKIEQVGIVDHLRESAAIMLEPVEWSFNAGGLGRSIMLNDEDRSNVLLFYREALHNLVRHAGASKATITLCKHEDLLTLEIIDNGCGIEPEKLKKDTTLRALKQRAQRLRGELEIFSKPGEGTRLVLCISLESR